MVDSLTIVALKLRSKDLFALISNGQKVNEALLGSHYGIVAIAHAQIHLVDLHVLYQANQICEPSHLKWIQRSHLSGSAVMP